MIWHAPSGRRRTDNAISLGRSGRGSDEKTGRNGIETTSFCVVADGAVTAGRAKYPPTIQHTRAYRSAAAARRLLTPMTATWHRRCCQLSVSSSRHPTVQSAAAADFVLASALTPSHAPYRYNRQYRFTAAGYRTSSHMLRVRIEIDPFSRWNDTTNIIVIHSAMTPFSGIDVSSRPKPITSTRWCDKHVRAAWLVDGYLLINYYVKSYSKYNTKKFFKNKYTSS